MGRNAVAVLLASGAAQATTAVLYTLAARWAGPEEFGRVAAVIGVVMTTVGVIDFGTASFKTREIASGRMSVAEGIHRLSGKCVVALVVGCVGGLGLRAMTLVSSTEAALVCLTSLAMTTSLGTQGLLRGLGRAPLAACLLAAERLIALSMLLGFTALGLLGTATNLLLAMGAAALLTGMGGAITLTILTGAARPRPRFPYQGALGFGVTSSATSLQALDSAVVATVSSAEAAGAYGAVARWVAPLNLVTGALVQAALPTLAAERTARVAMRRLRPALWLVGLGWCCALVTAAASPWLVATILGDRYVHSAAALSLLALATVPASISQIALMVLQSRGGEHLAAGRVAAGVAVQLLLVGVGAHYSGAQGAAAGVLGTQLLLAAVLVWEVRSLLEDEGVERA